MFRSPRRSGRYAQPSHEHTPVLGKRIVGVRRARDRSGAFAAVTLRSRDRAPAGCCGRNTVGPGPLTGSRDHGAANLEVRHDGRPFIQPHGTCPRWLQMPALKWANMPQPDCAVVTRSCQVCRARQGILHRAWRQSVTWKPSTPRPSCPGSAAYWSRAAAGSPPPRSSGRGCRGRSGYSGARRPGPAGGRPGSAETDPGRRRSAAIPEVVSQPRYRRATECECRLGVRQQGGAGGPARADPSSPDEPSGRGLR